MMWQEFVIEVDAEISDDTKIFSDVDVKVGMLSDSHLVVRLTYTSVKDKGEIKFVKMMIMISRKRGCFYSCSQFKC